MVSVRRLAFGALAALSAGLAPSAAHAGSGTKAVEPSLPPVSVRLSLTDEGPEHRWLLKLENTTGVPIKIADDPRLVWLDVMHPGGKSKTCRLPDDVMPKDSPVASMRKLRPGEAITHRIDPRFYCFSPEKEETLVPSAQVTPHYGWPTKTKIVWQQGKRTEVPLPVKAPFVAVPAEAGQFGPLDNTTGDISILDDRYAAWAQVPLGVQTDEDDEKNLEGDSPAIEMVRGSDAANERGVLVTVRVKNPNRSKVTVFVRRELLTFEVLTPNGTVTCASEPNDRNPDRLAFTSLAPHASLKLTTRLVELCERGTFADAGIYVVQAVLDANASGADVGVNAFTGILRTQRPTLVRVRHSLHITPNRGGAHGGAMPPAVPGAPPSMQPVPPPPPPPPPVPPPPPPAQ